MSKEGFWDNPDSAKSVVTQLSALKSIVEPVEELQREIVDFQELFELAESKPVPDFIHPGRQFSYS